MKTIKFSFLLIFFLSMFTTAWADNVVNMYYDGEDHYYTDMREAIDLFDKTETEGKTITITLLADVEVSNWTIGTNQGAIFYGGDYTLHSNTPINCYGSLTVNSGTIKIDNFAYPYYYCGISLAKDASVLNINGGKIDASLCGHCAISIEEDGAQLNITGGEVYGGDGTDTYAVYLASNATNANVHISGGKFRSGYSSSKSSSTSTIFHVNSGSVQEILGTSSTDHNSYCLGLDAETSLTDGWQFVDASGTEVTLSGSNHYVSVVSPEASMAVGTTKTVYKEYSNAWTAANVDGKTSTIYLLKDCSVTSTLYTTTGANITLENGSSASTAPTLTGTDSYGLFYVNNDAGTSDGLTINGGHYKATSGGTISVTGTFPITVNGGEFETASSNQHDVWWQPTTDTKNLQLNGGTFDYSSSAGGGIYFDSSKLSGLTYTPGNTLPSGKAYFAIGETTTPLTYSTVNASTISQAVYVGDCPHNTASTGTTCDYCGKTITCVAEIAKTGETGYNTYNTLVAAFDAATADQEIILTSNVTLADNDYITVDKNLTLTLGTYTLTGNKSADANGVAGLLHVNGEGATLTVSGAGNITNNNSEGCSVSIKAGTITTTSGTLASLATSGTATISNATVNTLKVISGTATTTGSTTIAEIVISDGNLVINGGTFTQTSAPATATSSNLTITAGTFSFNPTGWVIASSSIANSENIYTVTAGAIVAHVFFGDDTEPTRYASMKEAWKAAESQTTARIVMVADDVTETGWSNDYPYYLASGHTITFEGGDYTWATNLTFYFTGGTLNFNSGTLKSYSYDAWAISLNGTLNMNGGTIWATKHSAIDVTNANSTINITGGTLRSDASRAISIQKDLEYDHVSISGGTFIPASGNPAIIVEAGNKTVGDLLAKGYNYYLSDGTVSAANTRTLPDGAEVTVKAVESITVNNINYTITRINGERQSKATGEWVTTSGLYTAVVTGFATTPTESTSVTIPVQVVDPDNTTNVFDVDSIAPYAFSQQTNLTGLTIGEKVKGIGIRAFQYTSLTSITIPEGIEYIGKDAFDCITSLKTINYNAKNVLNSDYSGTYRPFWGTDQYVTALFIGENVTSIPNYMFYKFDYSEYSGTATGIVTSYAANAPTIETNTFIAWTKSNCTLSTPNTTTEENINSYKEWGFTKSSLSTLVLSDTQPTIYAGTYNTGKVSYNRYSLTSGNYGSFAVPFSYTVGTNTTGVEKAYQPIGICLYKELESNYKLYIYFKEVTEIAAGYPILAKLNAETVTLTSNAETTVNSETAGQTISGNVYQLTDGAITAKDASKTVTFGGTYVQKSTESGSSLWAFNTDGSFAKAESYVTPFRAYILCNWDFTSGAKGMVIEGLLGDDATAIPLILSDDGSFDTISGNIYDLNGRNLGTDINALPRGMYIINGKKIRK